MLGLRDEIGLWAWPDPALILYSLDLVFLSSAWGQLHETHVYSFESRLNSPRVLGQIARLLLYLCAAGANLGGTTTCRPTADPRSHGRATTTTADAPARRPWRRCGPRTSSTTACPPLPAGPRASSERSHPPSSQRGGVSAVLVGRPAAGALTAHVLAKRWGKHIISTIVCLGSHWAHCHCQLSYLVDMFGAWVLVFSSGCASMRVVGGWGKSQSTYACCFCMFSLPPICGQRRS